MKIGTVIMLIGFAMCLFVCGVGAYMIFELDFNILYTSAAVSLLLLSTILMSVIMWWNTVRKLDIYKEYIYNLSKDDYSKTVDVNELSDNEIDRLMVMINRMIAYINTLQKDVDKKVAMQIKELKAECDAANARALEQEKLNKILLQREADVLHKSKMLTHA